MPGMRLSGRGNSPRGSKAGPAHRSLLRLLEDPEVLLHVPSERIYISTKKNITRKGPAVFAKKIAKIRFNI